MSHRTLVTQAGTVVNHSHPDQTYEFTAAEKAAYQADTLAAYPGITAVEYIHLNHVSETLLPTRRYNCWGFTFNPRQCWINSGADVQNILNDNGTQVFPPNLRVGDVICYRDSYGEITHTGRIWALDGSGQPTTIQSKWGSLGEYFHSPTQVPSIYGTDRTYWRVGPLSGKGDAWSKDCAADDRLPYPPCGDFWLSPDLWCNNTGGTTHQNPIRGQPNQLWARVWNPDTLAITGQVHVYWADPTGGMAHFDWHPIGTATVNVPAGPGTVTVAGPITWTPGPAQPDHCCLFAIVDTGDDPFAAATLDPIVWPFDVVRDNNIIWKNVWIVALAPAPSPGPGGGGTGGGGLKPGEFKSLDFVARNPTHLTASIEVRVKLRPVTAKEVLDLGFGPGSAERPETPKPPVVDQREPLRLTRKPQLPTPAQGRVNLDARVVPEGRAWRRGSGGPLTERGLTLATAPVAPGKGARLKLNVGALKGARPGEIYRVDFEQRVGGQVTGGATYVVVIAEK